VQDDTRCLVTGGSGFIGVCLLRELRHRHPDWNLLNVDIQKPTDELQKVTWQQVDILDRTKLFTVFRDFRPTHVVHLAARTTMEKYIDDLRENTDGVRNLMESIQAAPDVRRLLVTSTCFVCRPGYMPRNDLDFSPHTVYGESKVATEKITRGANLSCNWTIIRPGTIWGPVRRQHHSMLQYMNKGIYFHPGIRPVLRPFGYVKNAAYILASLLDLDSSEAQGKVFYVYDPPTDLFQWVNQCSVELTGRQVRVLPRSVFLGLTAAAQLGRFFGRKPGITFFRYRSMVENYVAQSRNLFPGINRTRRTQWQVHKK
jgi:nucleoside-diphosphate-sugar epimerase